MFRSLSISHSPARSIKTCTLAIAGLLACVWSSGSVVQAADPKEDDFYHITSFETPPGEVLEAGAFNIMQDGRLAVATRRGEIWMIDKPLGASVTPANFKRFAHGLHEPLGLTERDGWLYVTQRSDVSRLRDTNGDGVADEFEVVADGWGISGDYHEYAFGSKFDKEGRIWIALCLTGSFSSEVPFRGWCMRVTPDGETIPTTYGLRSPGGIGFNAAGDVFYTDNQGPWNGTCGLKQLVPGKFVGHPGGNRWSETTDVFKSTKTVTPQNDSRLMVEAAQHPDLVPTAVMFPYNRMGQSASGFACDTTGGKFGPFEGQLFVGDQTHSTIMRVDLEMVKGRYQGACFPFKSSFNSGVVGVEMDASGALMVGGTNRGWGSRGVRDFSVERLNWTGKMPFEIRTMRVQSDGFQLTFTKPVDAKTATELASYKIDTYTYIYREQYGSPEVDATKPTLREVSVSPDGLQVQLKIDGLQIGHVHQVNAEGLRAASGEPLLHSLAYYTLNYLP